MEGLRVCGGCAESVRRACGGGREGSERTFCARSTRRAASLARHLPGRWWRPTSVSVEAQKQQSAALIASASSVLGLAPRWGASCSRCVALRKKSPLERTLWWYGSQGGTPGEAVDSLDRDVPQPRTAELGLLLLPHRCVEGEVQATQVRPQRCVLAQDRRLARSGRRDHLHQLAAPQLGPRDVEPLLVARDAVVAHGGGGRAGSGRAGSGRAGSGRAGGGRSGL